MCGINGLFSLTEAPLTGGTQHVQRMNGLLAHRGPDDAGVWANETATVCLGHRRLSILDLSDRGHQPMEGPSGSCLTYNGEIYNYRQLLDSKNSSSLRSSSDTEVLLRLLDEHEVDALSRLNGMFAFAYYDANRQSLLLCRDRLGKKPLYYCFHDGIFAFASEVRALLSLPWVEPELDQQALYDFLTFGFVPSPRTMFLGIKKLPPAHFMKVECGHAIEPRRYWNVEFRDVEHDEASLAERVRDELADAVRYRLVSDVPLGVFLSGGVDSSAVVAYMRMKDRCQVKSFSIGFEGQAAYDELDEAARVAKHFGTEHFSRKVSSADMVRMLPKIAEVFDEPLADPTSIPIYFLSEMANANGIKVVLTGDGPDELLLGYRGWRKYYRLYPWYARYLRLPALVRRSVAATYGWFDTSSPNYEMLCRAVSKQEFFCGGAKGFKENVKRRFLSRSFLADVEGRDAYEEIDAHKVGFLQAAPGRLQTDRAWMSALGAQFIIPNYYLHRMDRITMAHSVEARSPFLDASFVNLALSVDPTMKLRNGEPKYILKRALESVLPSDILYRTKKGFSVPMREWAVDVMADTIEDQISSFCDSYGVFKEAEIRAQVKNLREGNENHTMSLWIVYFLLEWSQRWLNRQPVAA